MSDTYPPIPYLDEGSVTSQGAESFPTRQIGVPRKAFEPDPHGLDAPDQGRMAIGTLQRNQPRLHQAVR